MIWLVGTLPHCAARPGSSPAPCQPVHECDGIVAGRALHVTVRHSTGSWAPSALQALAGSRLVDWLGLRAKRAHAARSSRGAC